jgi:hypothetical protein
VVALARRALESAPRDPACLAVLGAALVRAKEPDEAGKLLEAAGDQPEALLFLALLRARQGGTEQARKLLGRASKALGGANVEMERRPGLERVRQEVERRLQQEVHAGAESVRGKG